MASSSLSQISLPSDLLEEIFSTIPIEYLIQFHLICKQWNSLLKNNHFIYNYLNLTQERFLRIDGMLQIINPVTQTRINSPLPVEFPNKLLISAMIHCDGLVLLKFNNAEKGRSRLMIWNPILGQTKWIQPRCNFYGTNWLAKYGEVDSLVFFAFYNDTYGIGYDNNVSRDDHKILRFYSRIPDVGFVYDEKIEIEIYDLKSSSWKFLEDTSDWYLGSSCKGVSVIGNMYWVAKHRTYDSQMFIQSFDFSTETFKPRSNCLPFESHMNYDVIALSSFKRDKLCLLHQIAESKEIEVWVSNRVDEEVMSWNKYLSVASSGMPKLYANLGFFIDKDAKIRVWCEDGTRKRSNGFCTNVYEIGKDGIKEGKRFRYNSRNDYFCISVYVPSLLPLPQ